MKETEEMRLLKKVLYNQAVIYKRLNKIEDKLNNRSKSASDKSYFDELEKARSEMYDSVNPKGSGEFMFDIV